MDPVVYEALLERAISYLPFVNYDGKAGLFVLSTQRGYVDANGLVLEHQHVRLSKLVTAIFRDRNVDVAWEALSHTERLTIYVTCPETRGSDGCQALGSVIASPKDVHRLVALLQFVAYEGNRALIRTLQTWRFVQFVAAVLKGGSRSSQWTTDAWNQLMREEQDAWRLKFGPRAHKPKEIKAKLSKRWIQGAQGGTYLEPLAICQKRRDLLAFHALVLKTTGQVPEVPTLPNMRWTAVRALTALVDKDVSPFPLALVALFVEVEDVEVVSALRDYMAFWRGDKTASVFKRWNKTFWQGHPTAIYYVTHVIRRYSRLKSSFVRLVEFSHPKRRTCCPCEIAALYCKNCLEIKSIPNFVHPPPGRSIALDINADRVVCQLCKSTRIIRVPLFDPLNPSVSLSLSHPDRQPLHICDGSPFCLVKTSHIGTCSTC